MAIWCPAFVKSSGEKFPSGLLNGVPSPSDSCSRFLSVSTCPRTSNLGLRAMSSMSVFSSSIACRVFRSWTSSRVYISFKLWRWVRIRFVVRCLPFLTCSFLFSNSRLSVSFSLLLSLEDELPLLLLSVWFALYSRNATVDRFFNTLDVSDTVELLLWSCLEPSLWVSVLAFVSVGLEDPESVFNSIAVKTSSFLSLTSVHSSGHPNVPILSICLILAWRCGGSFHLLDAYNVYNSDDM